MSIEIEIQEKTYSRMKITVDLPYYYKHDLMMDHHNSVIYGKIEENKTTTIQITDNYMNNTMSYELEVEKCRNGGDGSYFKDKYKSSESEYLNAKAKIAEALYTA